MNKYNILLIAESASPNLVSVPLVAWSLAQSLKKLHNVHVVTQIRHRKDFIDFGLIEDVDFSVIDSELIAKPIYKIGKILRGNDNKAWTLNTAIKWPMQIYFEYLLWKKFKPDLKNNKYDIVHRVSPLSPTIPSPLAKKCNQIGVKFLLGPIAGGLPWPKEFNSEKKREKEWLVKIRDVYKYLPYYNSTRKFASGIIVASKATLDQMSAEFKKKCLYIPENSVDPQRIDLSNTPKLSTKLKLIFIGRLVPYKCADVAILGAMKLLQTGSATLDIYGDGPESDYLKNLVTSNKLGGNVIFHGDVPHKKLMEKIENANILLFPSIREFGGGVVLEAMALGIMPIVVNYGGPAELVTSSTGIKLKLQNKVLMQKEIELVLEKYYLNHDEIRTIGHRAQLRVKKLFTWDKKAELVTQCYEWVMNDGDKPTFSIPLE